MSHRKKQRSRQFSIPRHRKKTDEDTKKTWEWEKSMGQRVTGWLGQHHPVFMFLLVFGILMGLFYAFIAFTPYYNKVLLPSYHKLIARMSGGILGLLGYNTKVIEATIYSPRFSFKIIRGCDAVEATALLVCAVLAFPAPFLRKLPGIIAGTLLLAILNLVRVVSLFLIGVYYRNIFDFMHIDTWQAIFIFFAIALWVLWLLWTTQRQTSKQEVSSESEPNSS